MNDIGSCIYCPAGHHATLVAKLVLMLIQVPSLVLSVVALVLVIRFLEPSWLVAIRLLVQSELFCSVLLLLLGHFSILGFGA